MEILSDKGVKHVLEHKAHATDDNSVIAKYLGIYFWTPAATYLPPWLAPNMITLIGLMAVILSFSFVAYENPSFNNGLSLAANIVAFLGTFIFQTADNLDGKQARRIPYGTALGDFLDHTSDTLAISTSAMMAIAALGGGSFLLSLILVWSIYINATGLHWEARETGVLSLGNGSSITEAQVIIMIIHIIGMIFPMSLITTDIGALLCGILGDPEWLVDVLDEMPVINLVTLIYIGVTCTNMLAFYTSISNVKTYYNKLEAKPNLADGDVVRIKRARQAAWNRLLPFGMYTVCSVFVYITCYLMYLHVHIPSGLLFVEYLSLFILAGDLLCTLQIISRIADEQLNPFFFLLSLLCFICPWVALGVHVIAVRTMWVTLLVVSAYLRVHVVMRIQHATKCRYCTVPRDVVDAFYKKNKKSREF